MSDWRPIVASVAVHIVAFAVVYASDAPVAAAAKVGTIDGPKIDLSPGWVIHGPMRSSRDCDCWSNPSCCAPFDQALSPHHLERSYAAWPMPQLGCYPEDRYEHGGYWIRSKVGDLRRVPSHSETDDLTSCYRRAAAEGPLPEARATFLVKWKPSGDYCSIRTHLVRLDQGDDRLACCLQTAFDWARYPRGRHAPEDCSQAGHRIVRFRLGG
ncbi:MAG: hypothetical protein JRI68_31055 [Deltaproteobacteria bacterium]|nr:hypothetical protein [Deltaproteobacteria bacterium]